MTVESSDAGPVEKLVIKISNSIRGHRMSEIIHASAVILTTAICFRCDSRADAQLILERLMKFIERDLNEHDFDAERRRQDEDEDEDGDEE